MTRRRRPRQIAATAALFGALLGAVVLRPLPVAAWGDHGHTISGRAAAARLPSEMPAFFRGAADRLAYLNPEPDRWRDSLENRADRALNGAKAPEHYVDLELVPDSAFRVANRYDYARVLLANRTSAGQAGLAPWQILEYTQRLRSGFRLWRSTTDRVRRRYVEERIINDAGILGHYVTDVANPHHTSIHHNGWDTARVANPRGFTTSRTFHGRFESEYVRTHLTFADLLPRVSRAPRVLPDLRAEILAHIRRSHARLERLYELEQKEAYGAETRSPAHREFALERLAAGSEMLRDLWYTAWVTSGPATPAAGAAGR